MVNQPLKNVIQHIIRGEAVFVLLVRAQLCRRRFVDDRCGDHLTCTTLHPVAVIGVAPTALLKHAGLIEVFDRVIPARHITINRSVTDRDFRFVASGQKHLAKFVGHRHEQKPTQARLDVFFSDI